MLRKRYSPADYELLSPRDPQVPMPGNKPLRCLVQTAKPLNWQEAAAWIAEDAETLGLRRGLTGRALEDAKPELAKEIMDERRDWLMKYARAGGRG